MNVNWDFKAPVRAGDTITGRVEIPETRTDKPITKLRTIVTRGDGTIAWKAPPSTTPWRSLPHTPGAAASLRGRRFGHRAVHGAP